MNFLKETNPTLGERLADAVAETVGSWKFIGIQCGVIILWAAINVSGIAKVDPYPFSFLNLILGTEAALTGPILLIAGKRQDQIDRKRAIENLQIDKISYDDLKNLAKKIEDQFHHLDGDMDDIMKDIEDITK